MENTTRRVSRQTVIIFVIFAMLVGFATGAMAADARLFDATATLEKADALIDAARADGVIEMEGKAYDRALARAQKDIANARAHIADAIAIADGP